MPNPTNIPFDQNSACDEKKNQVIKAKRQISQTINAIFNRRKSLVEESFFSSGDSGRKLSMAGLFHVQTNLMEKIPRKFRSIVRQFNFTAKWVTKGDGFVRDSLDSSPTKKIL